MTEIIFRAIIVGTSGMGSRYDCTYLWSGPSRDVDGSAVEPAAREVGCLGPHAALRRAVLRRQHLQQSQAGLHIQREPTPRSAAGKHCSDNIFKLYVKWLLLSLLKAQCPH